MAILVPCGGGIDSSLLAYRLLRNTLEDVEMVYFREPHWRSSLPVDKRDDFVRREEKCFFNVAEWLKDNVRAPAAVRSRSALREFDPNTDPLMPVRNGFEQKCRVVNGKNMYCTFADEANASRADFVALSFTTWDVYGDQHSLYWMPLYRGRTDIPLMMPFLYQDGEGDGLGRFEVQSSLPAQLSRLVLGCIFDEPCGSCYRCVLNTFHRENCHNRSIEYVASVDDFIEHELCLGKYRYRADPRTYSKYHREMFFMCPKFRMEIRNRQNPKIDGGSYHVV